eukprot:6548020-Prymnesium_polylepis.1
MGATLGLRSVLGVQPQHLAQCVAPLTHLSSRVMLHVRQCHVDTQVSRHVTARRQSGTTWLLCDSTGGFVWAIV